MAATLPAGLLDRMICLTESLLASLRDKNVPIMSAAFSADETNHGKHAIQLEDVKSAQSKAPATSLVSISTLLAPDDISSSHALNLNRRIGGCHSSTEQNKIQGVSLREFRGLKKKSPIEMDTINRHRQDDRQVKCTACSVPATTDM